MKKIAFIVLIFGMGLHAQNNFKEGIITKSDGGKINALIGLYSWEKFPKTLDYKIQEGSKVAHLDSSEIDSLEITDGSLYIKSTVKVDVSSNRTRDLSKSSHPVFEEKTIFLKLLVSGKASLYSSLTTDKALYFYKTESQEIQQLIYKKYYIDETKIGTNTSYLKQLSKDVSCQADKKSSARYDAASLTNYFVAYNKCNNSEYTVLSKREKLSFNLKVIGGADYTSLRVKNYDRWRNNELEFDGQISPRIGLEFELYIPGKNKNSISGFIQTFYKQYNVNQDIRSINFDISYNGLELTPGLRYNINLKKERRVFIDAGLNINITLSESFSSEAFDSYDKYTLFESNNLSASLGVGYGMKRLNFFFKYYLPVSSEGKYYQKIESEYFAIQTFESSMQSYSLQVAYEIF